MAGHTYNVSLYYYFLDNTEKHSKYVRWFTLFCGNTPIFGGKDDSTVGTWKKFSINYTAAADAKFIDLIIGSVDAYFDDISIIDLTAEKLLPLEAGSSASVTYQYNTEVGKNIAVATIKAGFDTSKMIKVPYRLETRKTYSLVLTYKSSVWAATYYNGKNNTTLDSTSWKTVTAAVTVTSDGQYLYLGTPSDTAGGNIYIADISLVENTNTSDYQTYDFDAIPMSGANNDTITIASIPGADGNPTKALKLTYPTSTYGTDDAYTALDGSLVKGATYKLSFDYTGSAVIRHMFNMRSWEPSQTITKNTPNTDIYSKDTENHGLKTDEGEWKHYEIVLTAQDSWTGMIFLTQNLSNFSDFVGGTAIYFDNIVIEKVATYSVAVGNAVGGTATVSAESAISGSEVTFTATANTGYVFAGWKDADGNIVSTSESYTHTVTSDVTLTPVFETFKHIVYNFENGSVPTGCTGTGNYAVTASPDNENSAYSLKHTSSGGTYNNFYFKSAKLLKGHTYMISYDYYVDSSVADSNKYYQRIDHYSADGTLLSNSGYLTSANNCNKWLTTGKRVVATEDDQYFGILCSGEIYFDNVIIIDISDGEDYYEDFSENPELALIDIADPSIAEITFVNDEELGKTIAAVTYTRTAGDDVGKNVALPITLKAGATYRVQMTVKTDSWFTASYDGNNLDGANGINSSEWTTHSWYVTGSETNNRFYIATTVLNGTIYIADISVEIEKSKGDINNDGNTGAEDLTLLRKYLLGINDKVIFETACDLNKDDSINLKDLIRLKKRLCGIADVIDDASTLNLVAESNNVELESSESSLTNLGDSARFKKAVSGKDAYVIYRVAGGITEAAVEYDSPVNYMGKFTFEVSDDMTDWTPVTAQNAAAKELSNVSWIKCTEYFGGLGSFKYTYFISNDAHIQKQMKCRAYLMDMTDSFKIIDRYDFKVVASEYSATQVELPWEYDENLFVVCETDGEGFKDRCFYKKGNMHIKKCDDIVFTSKTENTIAIKASKGY